MQMKQVLANLNTRVHATQFLESDFSQSLAVVRVLAGDRYQHYLPEKGQKEKQIYYIYIIYTRQ